MSTAPNHYGQAQVAGLLSQANGKHLFVSKPYQCGGPKGRVKKPTMHNGLNPVFVPAGPNG